MAKNTNWDSGDRRRSIIGSVGADHINPASWLDDVHVASTSLYVSWLAGRTRCQEILASWGQPFDFAAISAKPGFNVLRPFGDRYVGIGKHADDGVEAPPPTFTDSALVDAGLVGTDDDLADRDPDESEVSDNDEGEDDEPDADTSLETIGLEDVIGSNMASNHDINNTNLSSSGDSSSYGDSSHFIIVNSKKIHIASTLNYLLSNDNRKKSIERLSCVQGLSPPPQNSLALDTDEITGGTSVMVGDLVTTLVHTGSIVAPALVQIGSLRRKHALGGTSEASLSSQANPVTIVGQVLRWCRAFSPSVDLVALATDPSCAGFGLAPTKQRLCKEDEHKNPRLRIHITIH
ncbi:hypothetical protein BOTBODRAFT_181942 [Botryobasidium botryosum FD-172 SS1]|uniref:Uncharacterized protein n=1 Tax=Botryobasidium botryosum (strain FD-172 SS1) TaxID=930990 RepID=A0A067M3A9_BOTB1|nr:hypothetical protein BOTBODRAFT_181942 [Botryobasidium botryosum FD-172 SS1]